MKRFLSMLCAVVFASLLFCFSVFATTETTIYADTTEEFEAATEYAAQQVQAGVVPAPMTSVLTSGGSSGESGSSGSPGSFIPSLSVEGVDYPYNSTMQVWLDEVAYGQSVAHDNGYATADKIQMVSYSLSQINRKNLKFVLSGFETNSTYTGVAYFQFKTVRASQASGTDYIYYNPSNTSYSDSTPGYTLLTDFLVSSVSCKDSSGQDVQVYYSRILSADKKTFTYTFYIVLQDYYVAPDNGVVATNSVVLDIGFVMGSQQRYYLSKNYTPLSYYALVNNSAKLLSRSFSGTVVSGRHTFDGDNRQDIADSQASLSESQHDDLLNGYNNSSGASAMESGASNVESGVASEGSALESAGASASDFNYDSVDLGSLATAFSLISGWFTSLVTALGSWNMLIMISLTMVVALFAVGYFRNK